MCTFSDLTSAFAAKAKQIIICTDAANELALEKATVACTFKSITSVFNRHGAEVFWVLSCGSHCVLTCSLDGSSGQHQFDSCRALSVCALCSHDLPDEMLKHRGKQQQVVSSECVCLSFCTAQMSEHLADTSKVVSLVALRGFTCPASLAIITSWIKTASSFWYFVKQTFPPN